MIERALTPLQQLTVDLKEATKAAEDLLEALKALEEYM